ncbi:MAG: N-6 DNA methylase [Campylobacterota bacterium]|nr:N-6 DNA methylase [Campylobacterota bacterium]
MSSIYELLQFTNVKDVSKQEKSLGVDKTHYSGDFPTVFFKEVEDFNQETLKEIAQIHHNLWNYKKVLFLYVTTKAEIRIYNCSSSPFDYKKEKTDIKNELEKLELARSDISDRDTLDTLFEIFSASAIDSGSIWTRRNNFSEKIKLNKRVDSFLIESLVKTAKRLEVEGLDLEIVHSLIMRSLFIMYLEDKGATPESFYDNEKQNAHSYFDLLDDKDATYSFFEKIKDNFNGNVFPVTKNEEEQVQVAHLLLIKKCFTNGDIYSETLFTNWRIFKFDIIQIELLSEIYEKFLTKMKKEETKSYYTPPALVELIFNEVLPVKNNQKEYQLKILDPTCGSGIFLVEAYKRIVQRWQNAHPNEEKDFKTLKTLMTNSIYGVELEKKSITVASFSLYLALLDFLNPKNLWYLDGEKFPYLINDKDDENIEVQGNNLFRTNTIEDNSEFEKGYDLIVGNPPYGKTKVPDYIKDYCKKYNFSQEFVIPFIHKSTLLAPKGKIALLATTKLLTNTLGTSQNFRKWLFNDNYVEKVYNLSILRKAPKSFGGGLFSSAVVPASIFFFQKEAPKKISKTIEYWAPKTYIKNHIAEGVLIDSSDIKYLPRDECQRSDSKIWKIAQWGTLNDFMLINDLNNRKSLKSFFQKNNFSTGVGFELSNPCDKDDTEIKNIPHLGVLDVSLYVTNRNQSKSIDNIKFRRIGSKEGYKAPHILIKEGIKKDIFNDKEDYRIISSYVDYDCSYYKGVIGIHFTDKKVLQALSTYFNSFFVKYFMFLSSSSWGLERDTIKSNELFLLPSFLDNREVINKLSIYYTKIEKIINDNYPSKMNILNIEKNINREILKVLNISEEGRYIINDMIEYTIDLFYKGHKSIAVKPLDTISPETILYAKKLCEELNETLNGSDMKLVSKVYSTSYYNPLSLIRFQFVDKDEKIEDVELLSADSEFNESLSKLNEFTLNEYSKSIYVQKNIIYYDDDKIYMIKPNQKRFWTQSQAIEDAQKITLEIMSMPDE